jgi:hypothetical protein
MIELKDGWQLHQDTSADWLFFHLVAPSHRAMGDPAIAEAVAREVSNTGIKRVVMDFSGNVMLFSYLVGQIVSLHKRLLLEGGAFRTACRTIAIGARRSWDSSNRATCRGLTPPARRI